MKRLIFFLIIIFLFTGYTNGQDDYLKKSDYKQYNHALAVFYRDFAPSMKDRLSDNPIVRFVPNYGCAVGGDIVSLEKDSLGNYKIIAHSYSFKTILGLYAIRTTIVENSFIISSELADLIKKLVISAINKDTNQSDTLKDVIVLEGQTYYFLVEQLNGYRAIGETLCPSKRSKMYELVMIFRELASIAKGKSYNLETFIKKINELNIKMN